MKRTFFLLASLALIAAFACLSCDQFGVGASPSPSPAANAGLTWTEVGVAGAQALQNGWGNYGGGYQNCAYALDGQGQLHIVGLLSDTTPSPTGEIVFVLPAGFRPAVIQRAGVTMMQTGFMAPASGVLSVLTTGEVVISPPDASHGAMADIGQVVIKLK